MPVAPSGSGAAQRNVKDYNADIPSESVSVSIVEVDDASSWSEEELSLIHISEPTRPY